MESTVTKKVKVCQYTAYCEKRNDSWFKFIAIYDEDDNKVAESGEHHPEVSITFHWNGFEFYYPGRLSASSKEICYVKINNKIFMEKTDQ